MVPGWFISELNAGGAKWGVEKTTKDLICIFALRSRPRPALVHKKMQTKYIKRFINQIQRSHTPKKEYQKREAFGIPFPLSKFSNNCSFGVFEPVVFRSNSSNSGLPIIIPYMNIVHQCKFYVVSNRLSRKMSKALRKYCVTMWFGLAQSTNRYHTPFLNLRTILLF